MSATKPLVLDPKLEELLLAVASDPESTLLRVPRPARMRGLFDRADPGQLSSVGRTTAERALLDTHRAELAWLLGEAAMARLIAGQKGRRVVGKFDFNGRERPTLAPSEVRDRLVVMERDPAAEPEAKARLLLEAWASLVGKEGPSPVALSTMAFALHPTPCARGVHALSLVAADECDSAVIQARHWIEAATSPETEAVGWETVCVSQARRGRIRDALSAQQIGLRNGRLTVFGVMNLLTMALQAGALEVARDAALIIDEEFSENDPQVHDFISVSRSRRELGEWHPTTEALTTARTRWAMDRVGASRRIIDALY